MEEAVQYAAGFPNMLSIYLSIYRRKLILQSTGLNKTRLTEDDMTPETPGIYLQPVPGQSALSITPASAARPSSGRTEHAWP